MAKANVEQQEVEVSGFKKREIDGNNHSIIHSQKDNVLICKCQKMQDVLKTARKYAHSNAPIQICGENGAGKEIIANIIHENSRRYEKPLVKINCSAIPNELIESELFGYTKGAFTGALDDKQGKFEIANGGTILLDEIGDLPLQNQPKLLRAIESKEITPLGSTNLVKIDVRILSSTNKDLKRMVQDGTFREDLYHRIAVLNINIPPLRERKEDIPLLASYFLKSIANDEGGSVKEISPDALFCIINKEYSGNVRELKNLIYRMYICSEGEIITVEEAEAAGALNKFIDYKIVETSLPYNRYKELMEVRYLEKQLEKNDFNLTKTASSVQMKISFLSRKLKEYGIHIKQLKTDNRDQQTQ